MRRKLKATSRLLHQVGKGCYDLAVLISPQLCSSGAVEWLTGDPILSSLFSGTRKERVYRLLLAFTEAMHLVSNVQIGDLKVVLPHVICIPAC